MEWWRLPVFDWQGPLPVFNQQGLLMEWWRLPIADWHQPPWEALPMAEMSSGVPVLVIVATEGKSK